MKKYFYLIIVLLICGCSSENKNKKKTDDSATPTAQELKTDPKGTPGADGKVPSLPTVGTDGGKSPQGEAGTPQPSNPKAEDLIKKEKLESYTKLITSLNLPKNVQLEDAPGFVTAEAKKMSYSECKALEKGLKGAIGTEPNLYHRLQNIDLCGNWITFPSMTSVQNTLIEWKKSSLFSKDVTQLKMVVTKDFKVTGYELSTGQPKNEIYNIETVVGFQNGWTGTRTDKINGKSRAGNMTVTGAKDFKYEIKTEREGEAQASVEIAVDREKGIFAKVTQAQKDKVSTCEILEWKDKTPIFSAKYENAVCFKFQK